MSATGLRLSRARPVVRAHLRRALWPGRRLTLWTGLACLVVVEVLLLTLRFDTTAFQARTDAAGRLVAAAPELLRIAIASVAAGAILFWRRGHRPGELIRELGHPNSVVLWLPIHLVCFAWFYGTTSNTLGNPGRATTLDVAAWISTAALAALSILAAAIPPRFWIALARRERGILWTAKAIGIAAWGIGRFAATAWKSSAAPTFWLTDYLLRLIYPEVVSNPARFVVGTPAFQVRISPSCSGYEGVGLVVLYLIIYIALFRRSLILARALWLVPVGAMAAWMLNVVRIAALVAIGDSGSPELALGGFHSQAGWLSFNAVALGFVLVVHRTRLFSTQTGHDTPGANAAAPYLLPILVLVAMQMLIEALSGDVALMYPVRAIAGAAVLLYLRRPITAACRPDASGSERQGIGLAVLIGLVVFALWIVWNRLSPGNSVPDPRGTMGHGALAIWLAFRLLGSVIVVPLAEELAFRGYLLRRLIAADFTAVSPRRFTWTSFVISSALFGLLHGQWVAGTLAGMAFAALLHRRGRLGDCVIAHATTNALLAATALATGDWTFWS